MKRSRALMLGAAALIGIPVLAFGLYIAVNFILPSIFTTPSVTGVPTARSNNIDALRTQQAERTLTATAARSSLHQTGVQAVAFGANAGTRLAGQELYVSCTAARGATATPRNVPTATPMPTATPEPTPTAPAESDFVFLSIVGEESEACYQVGEILNGSFVLAVGVTREIAGEVAIDLGNLANSQLSEEINVNLAQIRSDQRNRDNWMISERGFNFNRFPIAKFTDAELIGLPERAYREGETLTFQIRGNLQVREAVRETVFTAMGRYENGVLVVTAFADLKLTELGLTPPNLGFVSVNDDMRIVLNLVARAAD
ncbi:MAG: YceI family protein [Aggregatilineales bacterium]